MKTRLIITLVIGGLAAVTAIALATQSSGLRWHTRARLRTASGGLASAVADGRIYAVGGFTSGGTALDTLQVYDPTRNRWRQLAPMPTARGNEGAASVDGRVYAIGGYDTNGNALARVESYNPATRHWHVDASLPFANGGLAAAAGDDRIYAVGGFNQAGPAVANLEIYNPDTNRWQRGAPMRIARGLLVATWSKGRLYAIGGVGNQGNRLGTVESYDPRTNKWHTRAPLPIPRTLPAVATLDDGRILVAGGAAKGKPPVLLTDVELYTPSTDSWQRLTSLPQARGGLTGAVVDGDHFYAIGGFAGAKAAASKLVEEIAIRAR
jgi:N-acetylneuraminic acid mutarotase